MLCAAYSPRAYALNFHNPGKEWIVIGISTNLEYAKQAAEMYRGRFWAIVVLKTINGFYAISIGPAFTQLTKDGIRGVDSDIRRLIAEGAIPKGSYSTPGREFVDGVKVDFGNESAAYAGGFKEDRERKRQREQFNEKMALMLGIFLGLAVLGGSSGSSGRGESAGSYGGLRELQERQQRIQEYQRNTR